MSKENNSKIKRFFSWFNLNNKPVAKHKVDDIVLKHDTVSKNVVLCGKSTNIPSISDITKKDVGDIPIFEKPNKNKILSILINKLSKTKNNFGLKIKNLFFKKKIEHLFYEDISKQLLLSDVGLETTSELINNLMKESRLKSLNDSQVVLSLLKENMVNILKRVEKPLNIISKKPFSILVVGVNGVGKTSIIGKLTNNFKNQGKSVILAAGDTFRSAAIDQLKILGHKNLVSVIARKCGSDPASVIFDAFSAAKAKNIDVLIADTAGRIHNDINLMEELKKIKRVMKKIDCFAPDEIMLVLDSCIGQNSIKQAKIFNEALGITGLSITKLDGTAKGGVIFSIARQLSIPIRYISFGEKISDIHDFNSENFVDAIFSEHT
ncbi:MAG: signal recognition particle-docking protein FtsY [Buchnera aphidicola (Schlechtendalia peitan)]